MKLETSPQEFYNHKWETRTEHIRHSCERANSRHKMERLSGEIRAQEKVARGLKKPTSPLLDGYQLYHKHVRPHEALDGRTPAELCVIQVEGRKLGGLP